MKESSNSRNAKPDVELYDKIQINEFRFHLTVLNMQDYFKHLWLCIFHENCISFLIKMSTQKNEIEIAFFHYFGNLKLQI